VPKEGGTLSYSVIPFCQQGLFGKQHYCAAPIFSAEASFLLPLPCRLVVWRLGRGNKISAGPLAFPSPIHFPFLRESLWGREMLPSGDKTQWSLIRIL